MANNKNVVYLLLFFVLALTVRSFLISMSLRQNRHIDLCIYMETGALLNSGVNPYDFSDNVLLRNLLRVDGYAFNYDVAKTQKTWDTYIATSLPLTILVLGVIDSISQNAGFYRLAFAFFDSLIVLALGLYILRHWKLPLPNQLLAILALSVFSPPLIKYGAIIPEEKGIQILLMILSLLLSKSEHKPVRIFAGTFILGASIAFKLFGVFLVPLCYMYAIYNRPYENRNQKLRDTVVYAICLFFFTVIYFLPFVPHVFSAATGRFTSTLGPKLPNHASPWVILTQMTPHWPWIKNTVIGLLSAATVWGFIKKRISLEIFCANMLLIYCALVLVGGSLDRLNMGVMIAILLLGSQYPGRGYQLTRYYFVGGMLILLLSFFIFANGRNMIDYVNDSEFIDGIFILGFLLLYFTHFFQILTGRKPHSHETVQNI